MVSASHYRRNWPLSALVTDDMSCDIADITAQVIPHIGGSGTITISERIVNMSARQW